MCVCVFCINLTDQMRDNSSVCYISSVLSDSQFIYKWTGLFYWPYILEYWEREHKCLLIWCNTFVSSSWLWHDCDTFTLWLVSVTVTGGHMTTLKGDNIDFSGTPLNEGGLVASVDMDHKAILEKLPNWDPSKHWKTTTEPMEAQLCCWALHEAEGVKHQVLTVFCLKRMGWWWQNWDRHGYHSSSEFTILYR